MGYLVYLRLVPAINLSLKRSLQSMHQPPQQSPCWGTLSSHLSALGMSLLSHKPSDFAAQRLLNVCSDAWGDLHCLGSKHQDACIRSSYHSALGMSLPQTTSAHVVVCFPTGRLILRESVSPRCVPMHGVEASPAIYIVWARNIQTSVCIYSIALPELGSPDLGVDIQNR